MSNIDQSLTAISDYSQSAIALGIAVLLFVIGRKVIGSLTADNHWSRDGDDYDKYGQ